MVVTCQVFYLAHLCEAKNHSMTIRCLVIFEPRATNQLADIVECPGALIMFRVCTTLSLYSQFHFVPQKLWNAWYCRCCWGHYLWSLKWSSSHSKINFDLCYFASPKDVQAWAQKGGANACYLILTIYIMEGLKNCVLVLASVTAAWWCDWPVRVYHEYLTCCPDGFKHTVLS